MSNRYEYLEDEYENTPSFEKNQNVRVSRMNSGDGSHRPSRRDRQNMRPDKHE